MNLLDELETRVVCGDGAMGTLLLNDGVPIDRCFEELCVSEPARIQKIHEDYIAAGARVIETNTFGANAVRLGRFGMENRVGEINQAAVLVARCAAKNRDVFIAGSVGPLGITADEAATRGIDRAHHPRLDLGPVRRAFIATRGEHRAAAEQRSGPEKTRKGGKGRIARGAGLVRSGRRQDAGTRQRFQTLLGRRRG